MKTVKRCIPVFAATALVISLSTTQAFAASSSLSILRQGLLGAGTGAIAASASGGNAGKGALIGAGTSVIGGALLDMLTGPSGSSVPQPAPVYYVPQQTGYAPGYGNTTQKHIIRKYNPSGNVISEEEILQ